MTTTTNGKVHHSELEELLSGSEIHQPATASVHVPPLPDRAELPAHLGRDACPLLDEYLKFSRHWSPRSYDGYHVGCFLWLCSTIAARRIAIDLSKRRYTNLYIALVGRTSVWAKSSAADIAIEVLQKAGLTHLLVPDDSTPQAFVADMAGRMPADFGQLPEAKQDRILMRLAFAAQRGWYYEEFGQKINAMMRENGVMADYRGLLRRFDDCPDHYETTTIGRGSDELTRVYLALMANMTPADMSRHANKHSALWNDGTLARFGFICPSPDAKRCSDRFPTEQRIIPPEILKPLRDWHNRLGAPHADVIERKDDKGKGTGIYDPKIEPLPVTVLKFGEGVFDAYYRYDDALREMIDRSDNTDLDGNYTRLSEKALRIAMLLASVSNSTSIELQHWARAQEIAEQWRASLHYLIDQVQHSTGNDDDAALEDKLISIVNQNPDGVSVRDIRSCHLRGISTAELRKALDSLAGNGLIVSEATPRTTRYKPCREVEITV